MGEFAWFGAKAPPRGFHEVPPGGFCVNVFLFVFDPEGRLLLQRIRADAEELERLAGLDPGRRERFSKGWTIPARHLRFGEAPEAAAASIGRDILAIPVRPVLRKVHSETYEYSGYPGEQHWDLTFAFSAHVEVDERSLWPRGPPAWFSELRFLSPDEVSPDAWARSHGEMARLVRP